MKKSTTFIGMLYGTTNRGFREPGSERPHIIDKTTRQWNRRLVVCSGRAAISSSLSCLSVRKFATLFSFTGLLNHNLTFTDGKQLKWMHPSKCIVHSVIFMLKNVSLTCQSESSYVHYFCTQPRSYLWHVLPSVKAYKKQIILHLVAEMSFCRMKRK